MFQAFCTIYEINCHIVPSNVNVMKNNQENNNVKKKRKKKKVEDEEVEDKTGQTINCYINEWIINHVVI